MKIERQFERLMNDNKFDPKKLQKLNNPQRLADIPPAFIRDRLHLEKPEVVVEIGAGTAFFSIAFCELLSPRKVFACDVSEAMIDWVKENVSPRYPTIIPVKNEESSVPLDDGIADLLFMINLHHELDEPSLTVKEAFRILKPGGEIFIVDWKKKDMSEGPPIEIRCLPDQVKRQMVTAGFSGLQVFEDMPKHFLIVGKKGHSSP